MATSVMEPSGPQPPHGHHQGSASSPPPSSSEGGTPPGHGSPRSRSRSSLRRRRRRRSSIRRRVESVGSRPDRPAPPPPEASPGGTGDQGKKQMTQSGRPQQQDAACSAEKKHESTASNKNNRASAEGGLSVRFADDVEVCVGDGDSPAGKVAPDDKADAKQAKEEVGDVAGGQGDESNSKEKQPHLQSEAEPQPQPQPRRKRGPTFARRSQSLDPRSLDGAKAQAAAFRQRAETVVLIRKGAVVDQTEQKTYGGLSNEQRLAIMHCVAAGGLSQDEALEFSSKLSEAQEAGTGEQVRLLEQELRERRLKAENESPNRRRTPPSQRRASMVAPVQPGIDQLDNVQRLSILKSVANGSLTMDEAMELVNGYLRVEHGIATEPQQPASAAPEGIDKLDDVQRVGVMKSVAGGKLTMDEAMGLVSSFLHTEHGIDNNCEAGGQGHGHASSSSSGRAQVSAGAAAAPPPSINVSLHRQVLDSAQNSAGNDGEEWASGSNCSSNCSSTCSSRSGSMRRRRRAKSSGERPSETAMLGWSELNPFRSSCRAGGAHSPTGSVGSLASSSSASNLAALDIPNPFAGIMDKANGTSTKTAMRNPFEDGPGLITVKPPPSLASLTAEQRRSNPFIDWPA